MKNAVDCVRRLKQLGVAVEGVRRTGELRLCLPNGKSVTIQHPRRRRDASAILQLAVKRWEAALVGSV